MNRCTVCDSEDFLQKSFGAGGLNDVCRPCFFIWYDGVCARPNENFIRGEDIREFNLKARAAQTWPFEPGSHFNKEGQCAKTQA